MSVRRSFRTWIDKDAPTAAVRLQDIDNSLSRSVCPNVPTCAYGCHVRGLATRYDIDFIQTCLIGFHPGRQQPWTETEAAEPVRLAGLALGGCFCPHCRAAAEARGIDWGAMVSRLRLLADGFNGANHRQAFELRLLRGSSLTAGGLLAEIPELYAFLVPRGLADRLFQAISSAARRQAGHGCAPQSLRPLPELMGLTCGGFQVIDSVRSSDYSEQSGDPAQMAWKRLYLHNIRAIGLDKYFLSAISPFPKATPSW
jgi:hypothetical protein